MSIKIKRGLLPVFVLLFAILVSIILSTIFFFALKYNQNIVPATPLGQNQNQQNIDAGDVSGGTDTSSGTGGQRGGTTGGSGGSSGGSSDGGGSGEGSGSGGGGGAGGSSGDGGSGPSCGNNICEPGEDSNSCPQDCSEEDESQFNGKNVVLFYTDDQRWDTIDGLLDTNEDGIIDDSDVIMPNIKTLLKDKGVNFENSFVNVALCCPSRASLLSGGLYSANSGLKTNNVPDGGATNFIDKNSMFVALQRAGYKTALLGKYLNDYSKFVDPPQNDYYIPPGYDIFIMTDESKWDDYEVLTGSTGPDAPGTGVMARETQYRTYFLRDKAIEFINENKDNPFVLEIAFKAPHKPATPAPGDENLFSNFNYEERGWKEPDGDLTDKPLWLQDSAASYDSQIEQNVKEFARNQLRSLVAVDRSVADIIQTIEELNLDSETIFIYASDNGYMWGEHFVQSKQKPHEESIRVPLIVRAPNIESRTTQKLSSVSLDIGATIFDIANINQQTDGNSLLPLLLDENTPWKDNVYLEGYASVGYPPIYYGIRTDKYKYVEYADYIDNSGNLISDEAEFYNLEQDPYELKNEINNPAYNEIINSFKQEISPKKGLGINTPVDLPILYKDIPYDIQLEAIGGYPSYIWSIYDENLPPGLTLSSAGRLSGIHRGDENDQVRFQIMVQDSHITAYTEQPNYYIRDFKLKRKDSNINEN